MHKTPSLMTSMLSGIFESNFLGNAGNSASKQVRSSNND